MEQNYSVHYDLGDVSRKPLMLASVDPEGVGDQVIDIPDEEVGETELSDVFDQAAIDRIVTAVVSTPRKRMADGKFRYAVPFNDPDPKVQKLLNSFVAARREKNDTNFLRAEKAVAVSKGVIKIPIMRVNVNDVHQCESILVAVLRNAKWFVLPPATSGNAWKEYIHDAFLDLVCALTEESEATKVVLVSNDDAAFGAYVQKFLGATKYAEWTTKERASLRHSVGHKGGDAWVIDPMKIGPINGVTPMREKIKTKADFFSRLLLRTGGSAGRFAAKFASLFHIVVYKIGLRRAESD